MNDGTAHSVAPTVDTQRVAATNGRYARAGAECKRLPLSQYNLCFDQAQRFRARRPARRSAANDSRVRAEDQRYRVELQQCSRLPLSERNSCVSTSGISTTLANGE